MLKAMTPKVVVSGNHAGYLGCLTHLLQAGASINLQNKRGHTPLFVAVTGGHFFCVQHLIKVAVASDSIA